MRSTALTFAPWTRVASVGLAVAALALGATTACGTSSAARTCNVNADCASGQCRADGTCAPPESGSEAGLSSSDASGDGGAPSDGASADGQDLPLLDSGLCTPNADGIITADEVPLRAGLKGSFRVTTSGATISTAGTGGADGGGARQWDFSGALTGDHTMILETMPMQGQWFESDFPGAGYAARLSDSTDLLGVFAVTPAALELRGVVSPSSGSSQYKLKYDPVIPSLSFPLQKGKKWQVSSNPSGDIAGYPGTYGEDYSFEVDAEGELKTSTALNPFKVLRVAVLLKKTPVITNPFYVVYTRSYVYVAECFGAIAKVVSKVDQTSEPPEEFTDTSEIQRLAP